MGDVKNETVSAERLQEARAVFDAATAYMSGLPTGSRITAEIQIEALAFALRQPDTHDVVVELEATSVQKVHESPNPEHVEGDVLSVEPATHLLDWLEDAYTHCQHGSKEWCEGYLHNARDVIAAAQSRIQRAERERDEWSAWAEGLTPAEISRGQKVLSDKLAAAEAQLEEARKVMEAVGHIGVDFGYGPYVLEEKHIEAARAFLASLREKQDAE